LITGTHTTLLFKVFNWAVFQIYSLQHWLTP